jgi:hypothetical protein
MTAATVIFALTEDSIFYFSSVSPYALAVFLQLAALHLLLSMNGKASVRLALALEAVLTAAYLSRINLILFIALALAIVWVGAGGDRWRVYAASAVSSRRSRSICTRGFAAASYVSASRCAGRATRHWPRAGWSC